MPTEMPASRPCASITLALRSFDWLMIARRRAAPEVRRDLEADRLEGAANDAGGDGVDAGARRQRRTARDQPAVHFVGQRASPQLTNRQPA